MLINQILTTLIGLQLTIYTCATTTVPGQTSVTSGIPFTEFLKAYPEIERYLVLNVHSDDAGDNMNKARELLQLELSQQEPTARLALIDALQTFISLADHDEHEQSCDFKRYITLYYNYLASRSRQTTITSGSSTKSLRVARIVDQFALRHAQLCTDFYGTQVRERYNELSTRGDSQLESIEGLLDSALRSATGPNMVEDLVQHFQHQNAPVLGTSNGQLIYSILAKQSSGDPDSSHLFGSSCDDDDEGEQQVNGDLVIDREKYEAIERLFEKHIRKPCKNLVNILRDVMEPAAFDVLYHPKRQQDSFYIIWARYKLCDTMSTQVRQKLLTSIVEIACDNSQIDNLN